MKYVLLAYRAENQWDTLRPSEQDAFEDACLVNHEMLRKRGHLLAWADLQSGRNVTTVRIQNDKIAITDGPLAQTQEPLIGIFLIDARDLNNAIYVASKMPQARLGAIEVRPVTEFEP